MRPLRLALLMSIAAVAPASATPVLYSVNPTASTVTGNVAATLAYSVASNLGTTNGTLQASGALASSNESGTVNLEWGSPGWSSRLDVAAGGAAFSSGPVGFMTDSVSVDLFGLLLEQVALAVVVDDISLEFASPLNAPTSPLDPGAAGAGPWSATQLVYLTLAAQVDIVEAGPFGISIAANDVAIGPSSQSSVVTLDLSRVGGVPGTGSQVDFDIPLGLSLALSQPASTIPTPGCEYPGLFFGCTLDVSSVTLQLTSLTITNLHGTFVSTSPTLVPEPSTLTLFGAGLLAIGVHRRRRTRAAPPGGAGGAFTAQICNALPADRSPR